jgi:hypothetical protein
MPETKAVVRRKMGSMHTHEDQPSNAGDLMSVIRSAALDPRCDPAKMRELLNMAKEIEADEAKKAFTRDFIAMQAQLPSISRDGKIEIRAKDGTGERRGAVQQATPYATYNAIDKVIRPILIEFGFALSFSTDPAPDGRINVTAYLDHAMGHQRHSTFPLPAETSGSKNNVQGWGSSTSYGKRYGSILLLNIVSHDPRDADTDGHEGRFAHAKGGGLAEVPAEVAKISPAQVEELKLVMEDAGVSEGNFCTHYEIEKVSDLPADLFVSAKAALKKHKAEREARGRG